MNNDTIGVLGSNSRDRTVTDRYLQSQFDTLKPGYENYVGDGVTTQPRPQNRTKMDIYLQSQFDRINQINRIKPNQ